MARKQGHEGHIDVDKKIIMGDIKQLISRAKTEGIPDHVPKFLLGHSLGGLMVIYYALKNGDDEEFKKFGGLICIGKKTKDRDKDKDKDIKNIHIIYRYHSITL